MSHGFSKLTSNELDRTAELSEPSDNDLEDDLKEDDDEAQKEASKFGLCCLMCKGSRIYDSWMNRNQKKTTTEKAKAALIYEECLETATNKLVENSSWANATLVTYALQATLEYIEFDESAYTDAEVHCIYAWIYFAVIFVLSITSMFVPKCCEKTNGLRKELSVEKEKSKQIEKSISIRINNEHKQCQNGNQDIQMEDMNQSAEEKKLRKEMKIFHFVESEANELLSKLGLLIIATLSNCVAMGWRDAAKSTLSVLISSHAISSTVYFVYALLMTIFGIYFVIRLNQYYERRQTVLITYLENKQHSNTFEGERKRLLKFSFLKRLVKLIDSSIKFAIAWSWRDSINAFIFAVYGDPATNGHKGMGRWSYTIMITLFVSVCYAVSDDYHILYPKNTESQQRYATNKSRITVNNIIYDNLRYVVGMSWFDSINKSVGFTIDAENYDGAGRLAAGYWLVGIGGIVLSVIGAHYITRWGLRKKIAHRGLTQVIFDTFERFYDPNCYLHNHGESDMVPKILDNTLFEILNVTIGAWGIMGSLAITKAVLWTVYVSLEDQMIDENGLNRDSLYVLWVACAICISITLLFTAYIGRLVDVIRIARRKLFDKMYKDKKKQLKKLQAQKRLPRCGRTASGGHYDSSSESYS